MASGVRGALYPNCFIVPYLYHDGELFTTSRSFVVPFVCQSHIVTHNFEFSLLILILLYSVKQLVVLARYS